MRQKKLTIIGERINPGFRSTKALFDESDINGICDLALRQAQAGADYINLNIGNRALDDPDFLRQLVIGIQSCVDVPLSFDFPSQQVQELCLKSYDPNKARGRKPIVNSISEPRFDMARALKIAPARVIVMASERLEDGLGKPNKTGAEVASTAKRLTARLIDGYDLTLDDIIIDVSLTTLASDTEGLVRMALDGIRMIGEDPDMAGVHIMAGISNVGMMLPKTAVDGTPLKSGIERSFLSLACPNGFDTVLGTPWHDYSPLPADNFVLEKFKDVIAADGVDALRRLRGLYRR